VYNHNRTTKSPAEKETEQQKLVQELLCEQQELILDLERDLEENKRTTITWAGQGAGNRTTTTRN
jgi:hypothetical protein